MNAFHVNIPALHFRFVRAGKHVRVGYVVCLLSRTISYAWRQCKVIWQTILVVNSTGRFTLLSSRIAFVRIGCVVRSLAEVPSCAIFKVISNLSSPYFLLLYDLVYFWAFFFVMDRSL